MFSFLFSFFSFSISFFIKSWIWLSAYSDTELTNYESANLRYQVMTPRRNELSGVMKSYSNGSDGGDNQYIRMKDTFRKLYSHRATYRRWAHPTLYRTARFPLSVSRHYQSTSVGKNLFKRKCRISHSAEVKKTISQDLLTLTPRVL